MTRLIYTLLLFLCSFVSLGQSQRELNTNPDTLQTKLQREEFSQVIKRINSARVRKTQAKALEQEIQSLKDYALFPYLEYELIKHQIAKRPQVQITAFIERYSNLPFTPSLRRIAINAKYKARQWNDVISLHKDGNSLKYQCMYLRSLLKTGKADIAHPLIEKVWLNGQSLPKTCDPVLASWSKAGKKTNKLIKQRIELAFEQRNSKLAKYLAKSLDKNGKKQFKYWHALYRTPQKITQLGYWKQRGHQANSMMYIALERLIYQKPKLAATMLERIKRHPGFTASEGKLLINKMALRIITKDLANDSLSTWLEQLDWQRLNKSNQSQILRHLVGRSEWQLIESLFPSVAKTQSLSLEWQYWYAIALSKLDKKQEANERLHSIAKKRRYYGFLASDKLNLPYSLNHQALPLDKNAIQQLLNEPNLIRAFQLFKLDRNIAAQREWYYLVKSLKNEQRIAAAQIAHQWGWHDRAIITLTMTQQRDDLTLRFPTPHIEIFNKEAKHNEIDLSWPLAIARQESAFMPRANSAVGARGLMQLMPGTAQLQAKQSHVLYHRKSQLYKPEFNIKLGTGYLERMLKKFDNNLAVAAAAYNAGPHRVKHWVKRQLPQAQWIETIPYRETRDYVKNVLTYSVIYQQRLSKRAKLPNVAIAPERMRINAN